MRFSDLINFKDAKHVEKKKEDWLDDMFLSCVNIDEIKNIAKKASSQQTWNQMEKNLQKIYLKRNEIIENASQVSFSTGSKNIDSLLDGEGIKKNGKYLFYGKSNTGKTQLAHQITANVCLKHFQEYHGKNKKLPLKHPQNQFKKSKKVEGNNFQQNSETQKIVIYLDTEKTFRPKRIGQMLSSDHLPLHTILEVISVLQINSLENFLMTVDKLEEIINQNPIKLIVVDSLTNFFSLELGNEFTKKEDEEKKPWKVLKKIDKILKKLYLYSEEHKIPLVCISQVRSTMTKDYFFEVVPVLGTRLNRFIKQWVLLGVNEDIPQTDKNRGLRFAHLINGETQKEDIVYYKIEEKGLTDVFW